MKCSVCAITVMSAVSTNSKIPLKLKNKITLKHLTLCFLVSSADYLCKQFGSDKTPQNVDQARQNIQSDLDPNLVFLKEFFQNVDFEKNQQTTKKHEKLPMGQRVKEEKKTRKISHGDKYIIFVSLTLCPMGNFSCFFVIC